MLAGLQSLITITFVFYDVLGVHCQIEFGGHLLSASICFSICGIPDVWWERHNVRSTELQNLNFKPGECRDLLIVTQ